LLLLGHFKRADPLDRPAQLLEERLDAFKVEDEVLAYCALNGFAAFLDAQTKGFRIWSQNLDKNRLFLL